MINAKEIDKLFTLKETAGIKNQKSEYVSQVLLEEEWGKET